MNNSGRTLWKEYPASLREKTHRVFDVENVEKQGTPCTRIRSATAGRNKIPNLGSYIGEAGLVSSAYCFGDHRGLNVAGEHPARDKLSDGDGEGSMPAAEFNHVSAFT